MSWTPFRSDVSAQPLWRVARASRMNEASLDDNEERLSYGVLRGCMFFLTEVVRGEKPQHRGPPASFGEASFCYSVVTVQLSPTPSFWVLSSASCYRGIECEQAGRCSCSCVQHAAAV